jgi:hypothetical protein
MGLVCHDAKHTLRCRPVLRQHSGAQFGESVVELRPKPAGRSNGSAAAKLPFASSTTSRKRTSG